MNINDPNRKSREELADEKAERDEEEFDAMHEIVKAEFSAVNHLISHARLVTETLKRIREK